MAIDGAFFRLLILNRPYMMYVNRNLVEEVTKIQFDDGQVVHHQRYTWKSLAPLTAHGTTCLGRNPRWRSRSRQVATVYQLFNLSIRGET